MNENWYPQICGVGKDGTPSTYSFMKKNFPKDKDIQYAEFGVYEGETARNVAEHFPNSIIHLFDFELRLEKLKVKFEKYGERVKYYSNTQKYMDSYNWSLLQILKERRLILTDKGDKIIPFFDYCFLDGAHTFAIDALTFYLSDRLLVAGGYMDFDDINWRIRNSSIDPTKVPEIGNSYTDEQIDSYQVSEIITNLVRTDDRYEEAMKNKIFRKLRLK